MSRTYVWNVFNTTLSGALLTATTSSASLASATGLRGPGFLTIDPDSNTKREIIKFETVNGNDVETLTRGLAGSVAGAQDHSAGTTVRVSVYHQQFDDIWTDVETLQTHVGGIQIADHPEATASDRGFQAAADKARFDAALATDALLFDAGRSASTNPIDSTWAPVLSATTTNPTMGTGASLEGEYGLFGKLMFAWIRIQFGTGAANGQGTYEISLPFTPVFNNLSGTNVPIGEGYITDNSPTVRIPVMCHATGSNRIRLLYKQEPPGGGWVTHQDPWTWTDSDLIWARVVTPVV